MPDLSYSILRRFDCLDELEITEDSMRLLWAPKMVFVVERFMAIFVLDLDFDDLCESFKCWWGEPFTLLLPSLDFS
jgi:hypothetical protein